MTNNFTHASIIPLIGGLTLGAQKALGKPPEWIASWDSVFGFNDSYAKKYYSEVPTYNLETPDTTLSYVDIITALPPCAGLSMGNSSSSRGCNAASNIHMLNATEYSCAVIKPRAMIVENAPNLFTKAGEEFAEKINAIANSRGYTMSIIKTSTILHGLPQERSRSFFILWRGAKVPILNAVNKTPVPLHEFFTKEPIGESVGKTSKPSQDPLWQFIQAKHANLSASQIIEKYASKRMVSVWEIIYKNGWLPEAAQTVTEPKLKKWLNYTLGKKLEGLNIMDATQKLAWNRTQALMWKSLPFLRHPNQDRWLTTDEALLLMGFPEDFIREVPVAGKDANVICQNCPASTATDWVSEIAEALSGNRKWVEPPLNIKGNTSILRQSNVAKTNTMAPMFSLKIA